MDVILSFPLPNLRHSCEWPVPRTKTDVSTFCWGSETNHLMAAPVADPKHTNAYKTANKEGNHSTPATIEIALEVTPLPQSLSNAEADCPMVSSITSAQLCRCCCRNLEQPHASDVFRVRCFLPYCTSWCPHVVFSFVKLLWLFPFARSSSNLQPLRTHIHSHHTLCRSIAG